MAAILGPNDFKQYALPTNWDAGRLAAIKLESGETYEQLINDIAQGLAVANQQLLADPMIASLVSITSEAAVEQSVGVSNGFTDHTEFGEPDASRGKTAGWMLPLRAYDRKLGWTWDFLRKARRPQIDADIASAMSDLKNVWQQKILTRLFKSTYDAVGSGKSDPVADGGTADSAYIPVNHPDRAAAFAYTHTHLLNGANINQANLTTAVKHVWEHGHDAPYELLVSLADLASWTAVATVTGYVRRPNVNIRYGADTALAEAPADVVGVVETDYGSCNLRATARIPTTYWAVYKSYGSLDQRNPLVVRGSLQYGTNCVMLPGAAIRQYPLEQAILFLEFGVGVQDRVGAALWYVNAGAYTTPTIS